MFNYSLQSCTKLSIVLLFLLFLASSANAEVGSRDNAQTPQIRAALGLDLMDTKITLTKGGTVFNPVKNKQVSKFSKSNELSLRYDKGKISAKGLNGLYTSLIFTPAKGSHIKFKNNEYRGTIRAVATKTGIWIINHVDIEDYLYGVVPFEVPMSWNLEAVKAQAVAARTYAIRCLSQYPHGEFDVYDSTKDQVYGGISGEKEKAIEAVEGTRGIILSYQGWPIKAYYHADAGGQTEEGKYIFPGDLPYLKSVPSKDDLESHRWHIILTKSELAKKMKSWGKDVGKIKDVIITTKSPTGRPRKIEVLGSKRSHEFSSNDFRKMIGAGRIRSTLFVIVGKNDKLENASANVNVITISPSDDSGAVHVVSAGGTVRSVINEYYVLGSDGIGEIYEPDMKIITTGTGNAFKPKIDIKPGKDEFLLVGSGFGHGVGMSQWGAKSYSDDGWTYEEILLHYYRGADLTIWY